MPLNSLFWLGEQVSVLSLSLSSCLLLQVCFGKLFRQSLRIPKNPKLLCCAIKYCEKLYIGYLWNLKFINEIRSFNRLSGKEVNVPADVNMRAGFDSQLLYRCDTLDQSMNVACFYLKQIEIVIRLNLLKRQASVRNYYQSKDKLERWEIIAEFETC